MWSLALLSFIVGYLVLVLIGSHECFEGTIVGRWHYALTDGLLDGVESLIERTCGERGTACLAATEAACCQGSNPIGQVFFAAMFIICFYVIGTEVFPKLPVRGLPAWHLYTGMAAAGLCAGLFMAVTFCDPGIVTVADLDAHNALYPADGVLFQKDRHCTACGQARPARAKHCNATKRCVARFDHWCIWVNAPIGLYNTRWFLAFLLVTMCACAYGAVAVFVVVHAEMTERRAWDLVWRDGRTGVRTRLGDSWRLQATYVAANFGPLAGVGIFLGFAACIVAGFTTLQLYRIATGITTNEGFRLKDLKLSSSANKVSAVKHPYSRGWRRNFAEILLPHMHLEHARKELRRQQ